MVLNISNNRQIIPSDLVPRGASRLEFETQPVVIRWVSKLVKCVGRLR